jgi:hypothetical protein
MQDDCVAAALEFSQTEILGQAGSASSDGEYEGA